MSSPCLFYLRKLPSSKIIGREFGPCMVPRLSYAAKSVHAARLLTSSSIACGPSIKALLLCHHRLSCIESRTINIHQTSSPAASSNVLASLYSKTMLYHTNSKATKAASLRSWDTWSSHASLRRKQIKQHFGLGYFSRILDQVIFCGLLSNRVVLRWLKAPKGKLDWLSRTTLISDAKRGPCYLIEVTKPLANGPWTQEIIQERMNAVLYGMTQAFVLMHRHNCVSYQRLVGRDVSGGQSGYGSMLRKLLRGLEEEANRTLKGLPKLWRLRSPRR